MGMPYQAMKHFADQVASSPFEEEHRRYCLPVMDPHIIRCTEAPFNQTLGKTDSNLAHYKKLDVYVNDTAGTPHAIKNAGMYRISSPYPPTVSKSKGQMVNSNHVVATWSLTLTDFTFLSITVLVSDNG
jgi:hypothetical protein